MDPEKELSYYWVRHKKLPNGVPYVRGPDGEKVYQIKHAPLRTVENPIKYDKKAGLGGFHQFNYRWLREFLDDYLSIPDILRLGCVSKEWAFYCSDDKLWRRFARRMYKGDMKWKYSWKYSLIRKHNSDVCKENNKKWKAPKVPSPRHELAPYWEGLDDECARAFRYWYRASSNPLYFDLTCPKGQIDRVTGISKEDFVAKYSKPSVPVVLTDLTQNWPASKTWTRETLVKRHGSAKFRTGGGFKMTLKNYFRYLDRQHEFQPLYLFDQNYADNAEPMGEEYEVPPHFEEDLFGLTSEDDRPPYKWILVGPGGSGAPFHTDPRGTSAWNAVLFGAKRWAFYPPGHQPPGAGPDNSDYYDAPTAIKWYLKVLPTLKEEEKPLEIVQYPGETIFIPSGWWHMVYNCGEGINTAVTYNFADAQNFNRVADDLLNDSDDEFTNIFAKKLKKKRPDLWDRWVDIELGLRKKSKK